MKSCLNLVCRLSPVLVLLACAGGGGGGGSGLTSDKNHQDANNTTITGGTGYDFQTPVSQTTPVLQAATYPLNWDGTTPVTPPKVSPIESVYADSTKVVRDGSAQKPFLQSELNAVAITDPNAVVRSVSQVAAASTSSAYKALDYDLQWAKPDPNGPGYANRYASGSWQPEKPLSFWGQALTGCSMILTGSNCNSLTTGPSLAKPAQEVVDAWNLGWTGKGVNVLIEDFTTQQHGVITTLLAYRYAPGATLYGLNIGVDQSFHSVVNLANETYKGTPLKLGVVNASYVADLVKLTNLKSGCTDKQLLQARVDYAPSALLITNRFQDAAYKGQVNYTDAVITKAAGNDQLPSDQEPINKALADISAINNRLLIVGAVDQAGSAATPVGMASYSNKAGTDASVNSRYLLASGTVPFVTGGLVVDGTTVVANSNVGTSYAAPRVAGMVAIVRSKFPNLNASQTASIMLDTARYDTLNCYPACNPAIYGRGEASLSRALAPVGKLS